MTDLTENEQRLAEDCEVYLRRGKALYAWWRSADRAGSFDRRFSLEHGTRDADTTVGFFARLDSSLDAMGTSEDMFWDRAERDPLRLNSHLREYVMRYFLRTADFAGSSSFSGPDGARESSPSRAHGFGFEQHLYRTADGAIGRFPESQRSAIADLRTLGTVYQWILARVRIYDFSVSTKAILDNPELRFKLDQSSWIVLARDFIEDSSDSTGYQVGYAFVKSPEPGFFAYGPGEFDYAFKTIRFDMLGGGEIRCRMAFVSNKPRGVLNLRLDPVAIGMRVLEATAPGFARRTIEALRNSLPALPAPEIDPVMRFVDAANLFTFGAAGKTLGVSRDQLAFDFLVQHARVHKAALRGAAETWRLVNDWTNERGLPNWVTSGRV